MRKRIFMHCYQKAERHCSWKCSTNHLRTRQSIPSENAAKLPQGFGRFLAWFCVEKLRRMGVFMELAEICGRLTAAKREFRLYRDIPSVKNWFNATYTLQYVLGNPESAGEEAKARKPLAAAQVIVEEVEGNPGYYNSKFFLRPHYQREGLTVSRRLVSKLPSAKAAIHRNT